jgi:DNA-directed RNA polymerase specialized sigma24 family protein
MLNAWDGLDTHALGVALSITTNAAAVRLTRARARFREHFAEAQII